MQITLLIVSAILAVALFVLAWVLAERDSANHAERLDLIGENLRLKQELASTRRQLTQHRSNFADLYNAYDDLEAELKHSQRTNHNLQQAYVRLDCLLSQQPYPQLKEA